MSSTKQIALNYIYLSRYHAGGKDQVALNLLQGIRDIGNTSNYIVFCYDYSVDIIKKIVPDMRIEVLHSTKRTSELARFSKIIYDNTFTIPKLIKKYDISVIFHAGYTNGLRKFKAKSVTIPHDIKAISHRVMGKIIIPVYKYLAYRMIYHTDFKHADKIIAISDTDSKEISTYFSSFKEKVVRIYNPIKVENIPDRQEEQCKNIVAINLQFHHKNILTLIKAFEKIKDKIEDNLILVGSVPERVKYLQEYVEEHGMKERVVFTGFLSGKQKRKILVNSRLYVNPSLFEGFGMTAVEAIIMRVPTLLSKVSANYEVTRGLCDYYEPADNPDALAEAMLKALSSMESKKVLEEKSQEMMELYDYRMIAQKYADLFDLL